MKYIDYRELLDHGEIISKTELNHGSHQIYKICYHGISYHLYLIDGIVKSLRQWDSFAYDETEEDLTWMPENDLLYLFMFADRDRKLNKAAEHVYWLCVKEINARMELEEN